MCRFANLMNMAIAGAMTAADSNAPHTLLDEDEASDHIDSHNWNAPAEAIVSGIAALRKIRTGIEAARKNRAEQPKGRHPSESANSPATNAAGMPAMQLKDSRSGGLASRKAGAISCIAPKRMMPSMAAHARTRSVFIADENLL